MMLKKLLVKPSTSRKFAPKPAGLKKAETNVIAVNPVDKAGADENRKEIGCENINTSTNEKSTPSSITSSVNKPIGTGMDHITNLNSHKSHTQPVDPAERGQLLITAVNARNNSFIKTDVENINTAASMSLDQQQSRGDFILNAETKRYDSNDGGVNNRYNKNSLVSGSNATKTNINCDNNASETMTVKIKQQSSSRPTTISPPPPPRIVSAVTVIKNDSILPSRLYGTNCSYELYTVYLRKQQNEVSIVIIVYISI